MKRFAARSIGLMIGVLSILLLIISGEYAEVSVFELFVRGVVAVVFMAYGIGGNSVLANTYFLKIFSMPVTKEHIKNIGNAARQGKR